MNLHASRTKKMIDDQSQRHRKALRNVAILAVAILVPLFFASRQLSHDGEENFAILLKPIAPIMMNLDSGEWFTNQRLLGKLTFMSYRPDPCDHACLELDQKIDQTLLGLLKDLQKSEYNDQNKLVLQTVGFSDVSQFKLAVSQGTIDDFKGLFSSAESDMKQGVFVFDRLARLVVFLPEDRITHDDSRKIISKMVFSNYMDDYLSRRTFFGVKKDAEKK